MNQEHIFRLALTLTTNIGSKTIKQLISYCGSATDVFTASKKKLLSIPGFGEGTYNQLKEKDLTLRAEEILEKCFKDGIEIIFFNDKRYPISLKQTPDAPYCLYYKGKDILDKPKVLSIVGTRRATNYGKEFLNNLFQDLEPIKDDLIIVSGLAYGIDIHAHRLALNQKIATIGVMASGMDIVYPAAHKRDVNTLFNQGGVLTEYSPGTPPDSSRFPARNRIIAGLAHATLVVEADIKGGALITADIANSYSREVYALPGSIDRKYSRGCNKLIQESKAYLISSGNDLLEHLNWNSPSKFDQVKQLSLELLDLTTEETKIVQALTNNELHIDELCWKTEIPIQKMGALLLNLELKNAVKSVPGNKFTKGMLIP